MFDFLLALHILCAVLWVGGNVMLHVLGRRARAAGAAEMLAFTRDSAWFGPRYFAPLSVVLLVAGIFLVEEAGYDHSDLFVSLAYVGWFVSFVIGAIIYPRQERRIEAAAQVDGLDSPAFGTAFGRYAALNGFEITILLVLVIDMAVKPGL